MASTYSTSLRLELMATSDQSGTWGDTTNTNLGTLLEQSITGYLAKAMADANQTLTSLDGASDEARNMVVEATGALTAGRNVVVPTAEKIYLAKNSTTGGFAVTFKTTAGTGVAVPSGETRWVYCDGTNVVDGLGTLGITYGGTGAVTAAGARDALGLEIGVDTPNFASVSGLVYGLTLSNNVTDATNDIDIAAGTAIDSTNIAVMTGVAIIKQLDAAWAVGTNQGMRATGAAIANAWYHIFIIKRPDTGVVDIAADTSVTGANIPANTNVAYTVRRYIGSILRTSGVIKPFVQIGDLFLWKNAPPDINASSMGTAAVARVLTVPLGFKVTAILRAGVNVASGGDGRGLIYSPDQNDPTLATEFFNVGSSVVTSGSQLQTWGQIQVGTDTSSQVMTKFVASSASTSLIATTDGYINTRGRNG